MKENKIVIVINKPVEEVFEFTINPKNTPSWIDSIDEEIANEYPPKIGTIYKNRGKNSRWTSYKVVELKKNKSFVLSDLEGNYFVKYTYTKLDNKKTKMEYLEWMKKGDLKEPFTKVVLEKLKKVLEN